MTILEIHVTLWTLLGQLKRVDEHGDRMAEDQITEVLPREFDVPDGERTSFI